MSHPTPRRTLALLCACLVLSGCGEADRLAARRLAAALLPTQVPSATVTPPPSRTPTLAPTLTLTATPTETPTETPVPDPTATSTPSALAAIAPPDGWLAYHGVSTEFVLYHPREWRVDERLQNGVILSAVGRHQVSITVFDFPLLDAFKDRDDKDALPVPGGEDEPDPSDIRVVVTEYRGRPRPMTYIEARVHNRSFGTTDHLITIYSELDGGRSVMSELLLVGDTLTAEEIDTFIQVVATVQPTPETYRQVYLFPRDILDPARWTRYSGDGFRLKHPSSWEITEETEDGLSFSVPSYGQGTLWISGEAPDLNLVGDPDAIASLVSDLPSDAFDLGELEVISQGSLSDPLPCNYVELRQTRPDVGSSGHVFIYQVPLGRTGIVTGVLERWTGTLAPEEQTAFLEILKSIEHRPGPNLSAASIDIDATGLHAASRVW